MTGFGRATKELIYDRAAGHCECCGVGPVEQAHHRRPRAAGGSKAPDTDLPSNGLGICQRCHDMVESRRELALDRGWLVRQGHDPADVPVLRHGADWVLLQPDGGVFVPPQGSGRCERCGFHVLKQGHRDGCQVAAPGGAA